MSPSTCPERRSQGRTPGSTRSRSGRPAVSMTGLVFALIGYASSLTPTLVPRTTTVQVVAGGLAVAIAYATGATLGGVARLGRRGWRALKRRSDPLAGLPYAPVQPRALTAGFALVTVLLLAATPHGLTWQAQQAAAAGWALPSAPAVMVLTPAVGVLLVLTGRGLRAAARLAARPLRRVLPWPGAAVLGGGLVVAAAGAATVLGGLIWADRHFEAVDASTALQQRPASSLRSGGPGSLVTWAGLGRQGRDFVGNGPDAVDITGFTGRPALDPIRVFVGEHQAGGPAGRAETAVAELRRTGGFARDKIIVVVTSGLGAVHPVAATVAEYLADGDVATVATQYSDLPSWLTVVRDPGGAEREARALLGAVSAAVAALPADRRPELYLYGESLGAYGSQRLFDGATPAEVVSGLDGVLWVGSPAASPLRRSWPVGGPAWEPVSSDPAVARFSADPRKLSLADPDWGPRRVLLVQSPTDPVAYLETRLWRSPPSWLEDPRGPLVPSAMRWWPVLTFQQLLMDLTTNGIVPPGIGHNYAQAHGAAWAAVLQPAGWTQDDVARLNVYRKQVAPPPPQDRAA